MLATRSSILLNNALRSELLHALLKIKSIILGRVFRHSVLMAYPSAWAEPLPHCSGAGTWTVAFFFQNDTPVLLLDPGDGGSLPVP